MTDWLPPLPWWVEAIRDQLPIVCAGDCGRTRLPDGFARFEPTPLCWDCWAVHVDLQN